jgi:hypothetical protein
MVKILCFSKNRNMQLRSYIESLLFYSQVEQDQVYIIVPNENHYEDLEREYPNINWIYENKYGTFDIAYYEFLKQCHDMDTVVLNVDDVVYFRQFDPWIIDKILNQEEILGFTLRLGKNILAANRINAFWIDKMSNTVGWNYKGCPSHWGYFIELTASAYKTHVLKDMYAASKEPFLIPNSIESFGVNYCYSGALDKKPIIAMFNTASYAAAVDLNRVQNLFENRVQGTEEHTPENLNKLYQEGYRIDWYNYYRMEHNDPFLGTKGFKLIKQG